MKQRTITLFEDRMTTFPEKLDGLIIRLQERKDRNLKKEELKMHWDAMSERLYAHWDKKEIKR